jgi:RNA polymerase sigma-70 factor (ECF subfamily)
MIGIASLYVRGLASQSSEDLMLFVERGNALAFEELYFRTAPAVQRFVASRVRDQNVADETVQEVFCRVWERRNHFAQKSSATSYLCGIASNVIREHRRAVAKAIPLTAQLAQGLVAEGDGNDSLHDGLAQSLGHARLKLSDRQQEAVHMIYDEQMALSEAMQALGCSEKALRRRLEEAYRKLYNCLQPIRQLPSSRKTP